MNLDAAENADDLTHLLQQASKGSHEDRGRVLEHSYEQVKAIARSQIRRRGLDRGATSLAQDAVLKLMQKETIDAPDRSQFFGIVTRAIKDVLRDHYRSKGRVKNGGGRKHVPLVELRTAESTTDVTAEELHDALSDLERADLNSARGFVLTQLLGTTLRGASELQGRTLHETRQDVEYAKAWLKRRLDPDSCRDEGRAGSDGSDHVASGGTG